MACRRRGPLAGVIEEAVAVQLESRGRQCDFVPRKTARVFVRFAAVAEEEVRRESRVGTAFRFTELMSVSLAHPLARRDHDEVPLRHGADLATVPGPVVTQFEDHGTPVEQRDIDGVAVTEGNRDLAGESGEAPLAAIDRFERFAALLHRIGRRILVRGQYDLPRRGAGRLAADQLWTMSSAHRLLRAAAGPVRRWWWGCRA